MHHQITLLLREISVQGSRGVAVRQQLLCNFLSVQLGVAKHHAKHSRSGIQQTTQAHVLVLARHNVRAVVNLRRRLVALAYLNANRLVHELFGDARDGVRHGCRKQPHVNFRRRQGKNLADVVHKAHVEHFVGLVQNHVGQLIQVQHSAALQIHQSARSGNDDVHALFQGLDLGGDVGATVHRQQTHGRQMGRILFQLHGNLHAQFACGRQNQGLWAAGWLTKILQQGQAKGGRFTCSGLGQGHQIHLPLDGQKLFHHPGLNLRWRRKSQVGNRLEKLWTKSERIKIEHPLSVVGCPKNPQSGLLPISPCAMRSGRQPSTNPPLGRVNKGAKVGKKSAHSCKPDSVPPKRPLPLI